MPQFPPLEPSPVECEDWLESERYQPEGIDGSQRQDISHTFMEEAGESPTLTNATETGAPGQVQQAMYLGEIRQQHSADALIAGGI